jgi:hypothetical protein
MLDWSMLLYYCVAAEYKRAVCRLRDTFTGFCAPLAGDPEFLLQVNPQRAPAPGRDPRDFYH